MNILRRCVGATATFPPPLSLSSRTRSSPYSTNQLGPEHSSPSIRSPEVNELAKEPMADSSHPREIPPYQMKAANLVKLLGHIKLPVKFQSLRDGKHYAATLISDSYKKPIDKACLIPVLFEGDLAHVVSCHVKENDCVYVTGKLSSDPFPFLLQDNQLPLHILAEDINFVEGFDEKAYDYSSKKKESIGNVKNSMSETNAHELWSDLMKNPNQWVSYADDKSKGLVSPIYPDFKHIENAASLWLSSAPEWFLARIESSDLDIHCSKEKLWKSLAENPNQWVSFIDDKSKGLVSPKYPDFKHTEISASLWLGRAPKWFLARIENLDLDTHCSKEKLWKSLAENPDQWRDYRAYNRSEKTPDFRHKKFDLWLWIKDSPEWFVAKDIEKLKDTKAEEAWKSLAENPNQWASFIDDKSKGLVSPKYPDFKHTENAASLWLHSAPAWFLARIKNLDVDTHCSKESLWKSLAENPDQWWDYRADKRTGKSPDFKHKKFDLCLWIKDSPEWFVAKDIEKLKDTNAEAWKSLVENPSQWWDNRLKKSSVNAPDFKHKDKDAGLWLEHAPDWIVSKLPPLKQNQNENAGGVWIKDKDSPEWFVAKDIGKLKDTKAEAWKSLVENPSQWWDNRLDKASVKSPDFKHKDNGVRLWLNHAPDWVVSKLPPLKQNQNAGGV